MIATVIKTKEETSITSVNELSLLAKTQQADTLEVEISATIAMITSFKKQIQFELNFWENKKASIRDLETILKPILLCRCIEIVLLMLIIINQNYMTVSHQPLATNKITTATHKPIRWQRKS